MRKSWATIVVQAQNEGERRRKFEEFVNQQTIWSCEKNTDGSYIQIETQMGWLQCQMATLIADEVRPIPKLPVDDDGMAELAKHHGAEVAWAKSPDMYHLITFNPVQLRDLLESFRLQPEYN